MKYLDYPQLAALSSSLSHETSESRTYARLEAYSCKPIAKERKLFRSLEEQHVVELGEMDELAFSPEMREAGLSSCFGSLDEKTSRKVHFLLVSTLNVAFPDHDFSGLRADHFTREPSAAAVLATLGSSLLTAANGLSRSFDSCFLQTQPSSASPASSPVGSLTNPALHQILRTVIDIEDCEVYSYLPEPEYDPHNHTLEQEEEFTDSESGDLPAGDISMDDPMEPGWGTAGMELDDVPNDRPFASSPPDLVRGSSNSSPSSSLATWRDDEVKHLGGLLWSANYFFFCKRQKRILFITCWSRKRSSTGTVDSRSPLQMASPVPAIENMAFPPPISSSSFSAQSSSWSQAIPLARTHHNRSNPRTTHKKYKLAQAKLAAASTSKGLLSKSAPAPASPAVSLSRTTANGSFKPRQTPARVLINAAEKEREEVTAAAAAAAAAAVDSSRIRKDRSESATPGPAHALSGLKQTTPTPGDAGFGKRVKM